MNYSVLLRLMQKKMGSQAIALDTIPGEQARREAARWVLWCYVILSALGITLHIISRLLKGHRFDWVYLIPVAIIGIAALVSLSQLKHTLSRAMMLFAWVTFFCLATLLIRDISLGNGYIFLLAMFAVGIFTLGIILGFRAAISYAMATAVLFLVVGAFYFMLPKMIVPSVLVFAVALPAKTVAYLIEQSTRDFEAINQHLEDIVTERTAELDESNRYLKADMLDRVHVEEVLRQRTVELESRNEELNAYAHTVAHDIKSPLASIIGFGELLERHYTQFTEDQLTYYFGVIARNGRKITNIVDELLLLSSVREAEVVDIGPLDMAAIVDEAQHRLIHDIAERMPEIILPEAWPVALGYAPWVEEIWTNYISNAIKYGGDPPRIELGYTILEAGSLELDPALNIEHPASSIQFWLRDNGPGLTLEEQARLFTPFTRLDQVRAKGHGLGLSIVRRIAERLNGEVGVESVIGQGSIFFFTLPAAPAQPEQMPGDDGDMPTLTG
jgi:signal transduction histidine kinase